MNKQEILIYTAIITSWVTFFVDLLNIFGLIIWISIIVYLIIKTDKKKLYTLILSAYFIIPFYNFLKGTNDYFHGNATYESYGKPSDEFWNLDPKTRLWRSTSGCIVDGFEIFTQSPNNIAINFWTNIFGSQPNVYKGYYPTSEEVDTLLNTTTTIIKIKTKNDNEIYFNLGNKNYKLTVEHLQSFNYLEKCDSAKVLIIKNQCLVFRILGDTMTTQTILADNETGKVFAKYYK